MSETVVGTSEVVETAEPVVVNYWGTDERFRHMLPDGVQYFECKVMSEGDKAKFQRSTNTDLTIGRDQSAKMKVDPVGERHQLIKTSVVNWHLYAPDEKNGGKMALAAFAPNLLEKWLQSADPKIVEDLERTIRLNNPWMQSEMTTEGIDEEIERLYELRKKVVEQQAGESGSGIK